MIGPTSGGARRHRHGAVGDGAPGTESARLARHAGQELEWVQRSWWHRTWELRAGDSVLLHLDSVNWWSRTLSAELDGERILFGKSLWRETAVRERDGAEVGRLHRTGMRLDEESERLEMSRWWGTGCLDYAGGERAWMKRTPWASQWTVLDARGRELATIERQRSSFVVRGLLRLTPLGVERPALALLTVFSWWIVTGELARQSHGAH